MRLPGGHYALDTRGMQSRSDCTLKALLSLQLFGVSRGWFDGFVLENRNIQSWLTFYYGGSSYGGYR